MISKKNLIIYTIILCVALVSLFIITLMVTIKSNKEYQLKNFHHENLFTAIKWLQDRDLNFYLVEKFNTEEEPYTVIEQIPSSGTFVKRSRTVQLIVSSPNQSIRMPDYIGRDIEIVKDNLLTLFSLNSKVPSIKIVERHSTNEGEGIVIKQSPKKDNKINFEQGVLFVVSKGQNVETVVIENYRWKRYAKVYEELKEMGLKVNAHYEQTPHRDKIGKIFQQDTIPGKTLKPSDQITFVVGTKITDSIKKTEILRFITLKIPRKSYDINHSEEENLREHRSPKTKKNRIRKITIYVKDSIGKRLVFRKKIQQDKIIDIPYKTLGSGVIEIYVDDSLYKKTYF